MLAFIEFLKKRPSDAAIRAIRAILSLVVAFLLSFYAADYRLPFHDAIGAYALYVQYAIAALFLLPAMVAAAGICVTRRKIMKRMQMITGLLLIAFGIATSPVAESPKTPSATVSAADLASAVSAKSPFPVGGILILIGTFTLLGGATGKLVTGKCQKYGETIKKIRV